MSSLRITIGTIAVAALLFAWGVWRETAILAGPHVTVDWSTTAVSGSIAPEPMAREGTSRERLVDMYGNEVHRAIGDYRIDFRGDVYERHSPHTALPDLGPPST